MRVSPAPLRCPCEGAHFVSLFSYEAPPEGEVRFAFASSGPYRREVFQCALCAHCVSTHGMDDRGLYLGDYTTSNYGKNGLESAFQRIVDLDEDHSDNAGRVRRILDLTASIAPGAVAGGRSPSVLDVGSGLCVFLHRMKAAGWTGTALDPDARAVSHARDRVGVAAVRGDFMTATGLDRYDLITFNKVLEHVQDPVGMLARALAHLAPGGFVYVEVPDGESAAADGPGREEFFIDHYHVFSAASLALLAVRAGFAVRRLERLREPSGKYTLWAALLLLSRTPLRRPVTKAAEEARREI